MFKRIKNHRAFVGKSSVVFLPNYKTLYPAEVIADLMESSERDSFATTVTFLFSTDASADLTPLIAKIAFSTCALQLLHIIPSTSMVTVFVLPNISSSSLSLTVDLLIYIFLYLSLNEFKTTHTDEKLIAAEAIMGVSVIPKAG